MSKTTKIVLIVLGIVLVCAISICGIIFYLYNRGLSTIQTSARDVERRTALETINLEILSYNNFYGKNPSQLNLNDSGTLLSFDIRKIELKSSAIAAENTKTKYCYSTDQKGYVVGVYLESEKWYKLGTNQNLDCKEISKSK